MGVTTTLRRKTSPRPCIFHPPAPVVVGGSGGGGLSALSDALSLSKGQVEGAFVCARADVGYNRDGPATIHWHKPNLEI